VGTALVTGAASGMGQATAAMFLDRGWRVLGLDITANLGIDHPALTALTVDIRDGEAVSAVVGAAVASTGIDTSGGSSHESWLGDRELCLSGCVHGVPWSAPLRRIESGCGHVD